MNDIKIYKISKRRIKKKWKQEKFKESYNKRIRIKKK